MLVKMKKNHSEKKQLKKRKGKQAKREDVKKKGQNEGREVKSERYEYRV